TDTGMFGFYIYNNVGIAFRCFATGMLFGLGSAYFLVYNGFAIGAVLGFVISAGHGNNILTFICGHGPFELTAIVISGAAGLRLGHALIETKGRTRLGSVRAITGDLVTLVLGAGAMLVIAAILEGYWSPSGLAPPIKWSVGLGFSVLVTLWLGFAGRTRSPVTTTLASTVTSVPQ
ncbi:MAG: putative membrane protein SpoIIM required for sporulation, partial [Myxococcota bacterium]